MEGYKLTYHVDMVFCIDATGSMRHVLDFVKQNALNLYRDVVAEMEKKHKVINQLRVRVIAFRDYLAD
ncbi:MAG: VWA domain-containing protein, partial [Clostridia bacterium]